MCDKMANDSTMHCDNAGSVSVSAMDRHLVRNNNIRGFKICNHLLKFPIAGTKRDY